MFRSWTTNAAVSELLLHLITIGQPLIGLILFVFGWRMINGLTPLLKLTMFIP